MQPKAKQKIKLVAGLGLSSLVFGGGLFRVLWVHLALPGWTTFGAVLHALRGNYAEMGAVAGPVVVVSMYDAWVKRNEYGVLGRRLLSLPRKARLGGQSYRRFRWAREKQKRDYPAIDRELPLEFRNYLAETLLRSRNRQIGRRPKGFAEELRRRSVRVSISGMLAEERQTSSQEQMFVREMSQKSKPGQLKDDLLYLKREKDCALLDRIQMDLQFQAAGIDAYAGRWDIYRLTGVSIPAAEDALTRAKFGASLRERSGNQDAIRRANEEVEGIRKKLEKLKADLHAGEELVSGKGSGEENPLMMAQLRRDQAIYRQYRLEKNWMIGVQLALSQTRPEEWPEIERAAITVQLVAPRPIEGMTPEVSAIDGYWEQATEGAYSVEFELLQAEEALWLARRAYDEARLDPLSTSLVEKQTALEEAKVREEQARKAWQDSREARARLCAENSPPAVARIAAELERNAIKDAEFVRGQLEKVQFNVPDVQVSHLHARVKFLRSRSQAIKRQRVYRRTESARQLIQRIQASQVTSSSIERGQTTSRLERLVGEGALAALALKEYWGVRLGAVYPSWPVLDLVNRVTEYPTVAAATFGYAVYSLAWISWLRPVREHLTFERSVTVVSSSAKGVAKATKYLIVPLHHKELKKANPEEYQRLREERRQTLFRFLMFWRRTQNPRDILISLCATTRHPTLIRIRHYLTEAPRQTPEQRQAVIAEWKMQRRMMLISKADQRTVVRTYEAELHAALSDCMHARWRVRHERLLTASTAIEEASELMQEIYGASSSTTGKEEVDPIERLKVVRANVESAKEAITSSDPASGIEVLRAYRLFLDKEAEYQTALRHWFFPLTGPPGEEETTVITRKAEVRDAAQLARSSAYERLATLPGEDERFENECRTSLEPHLNSLIEITEKLQAIERQLTIATADLSQVRLLSRAETERRDLTKIFAEHVNNWRMKVDLLTGMNSTNFLREVSVGQSWLRFRTAKFKREEDRRSKRRVERIELGKVRYAIQAARLSLSRSRLPGARSTAGAPALDSMQFSATSPRDRARKAHQAALGTQDWRLGTPDSPMASRGRHRSAG
jgi:hypothetical protein